MLLKVRRFIAQEQLLQAGETVVVGVSGGADSICLLTMLAELSGELEIRLEAVHVNHGIRGAEADRDEAFVRKYCESLKIPFHGFSCDVPMIAKEQHLTEEEAGRMVRRESFQKVMEETGGRITAVAHNLNDNAETVLFHLLRGKAAHRVYDRHVKAARAHRAVFRQHRFIRQFARQAHRRHAGDRRRHRVVCAKIAAHQPACHAARAGHFA